MVVFGDIFWPDITSGIRVNWWGQIELEIREKDFIVLLIGEDNAFINSAVVDVIDAVF